MLTRYRLALFVSSLAVGGALLACPHPDSVYEDFVDRVPDAKRIDMDSGCAAPIAPGDVNGRFLLGIQDRLLGTHVFRFIADVTLAPVAEGGQLTWTLTPLDRDTKEVVPGVTPVMVGPATVDMCAGFRLTKATFVIPARTSITTDATITNVVLTGSIRNPDLMCGTAAGTVTVPAGIAPLQDGPTTFAAIRVGPTDIGATLPDDVFDCPDMGADAL